MAEEMNEELENEIIETVDENGNKFKFELYSMVNFEDKIYAVLEPVEVPEDIENDEDEIVIMRVNQQGEEYSLEFIESDEEFDRVREYLEQLENEAAEE